MQAKMKRCLLGAAFGASLIVTGCQTVQTTRSGVVGVDRPQQMSVFTPSAAEVAATARQQYLQVTQVAAQKGAFNRDPTQTARVQRIAQRLIPHTTVFRDDAVCWQWQVNVLTSNEVKAWCMDVRAAPVRDGGEVAPARRAVVTVLSDVGLCTATGRVWRVGTAALAQFVNG